MLKKYIQSATLGITIGIVISLVMSAIFGGGTYFPVNPHSTLGIYYHAHFEQVVIMALSVGIWALIGLLFQAMSQIFDKSWSLLRATVTHFLGTAVGFTALGIVAGWFPLDVANLLFFLGIYIAIYSVIYMIHYKEMSSQIQKINDYLEKK